METIEMKVMRKIAGRVLMDRKRSEDIGKICNIDNINNWILPRKKAWNEVINRMNKSPIGHRSMENPVNDEVTSSQQTETR